MQDEEIIKLYFERNEEALSRTQEKYGRYCYAVAYRILAVHEDSEECVSDTWLAAWNLIPPKIPQVLRLFLAKITRSQAIDRWRGSHAAKRGGGETALVLEELEECLPDGGSSPEEEVLAAELSAAVDAWLRKLPERDRALFLRRYFFHEPVQEIAADLGLTENNASVILHRIRTRLKEHLEKEGMLG